MTVLGGKRNKITSRDWGTYNEGKPLFHFPVWHVFLASEKRGRETKRERERDGGRGRQRQRKKEKEKEKCSFMEIGSLQV